MSGCNGFFVKIMGETRVFLFIYRGWMMNSSTNSSINLYSVGVSGFRYPFNKDSLFSVGWPFLKQTSQFSFYPRWNQQKIGRHSQKWSDFFSKIVLWNLCRAWKGIPLWRGMMVIHMLTWGNSHEIKVENISRTSPTSKYQLVGAEPRPCCSFAHRLVGKTVIHCLFAHH